MTLGVATDGGGHLDSQHVGPTHWGGFWFLLLAAPAGRHGGDAAAHMTVLSPRETEALNPGAAVPSGPPREVTPVVQPRAIPGGAWKQPLPPAAAPLSLWETPGGL